MSAKPTSTRNVPCPFCSLLCDDLTVENHSGQLKVTTNLCARASRLFERREPVTGPSIQGKPVAISEALDHAAALLKNAGAPLFTGSATDVSGTRSLISLAEKTGATLEHMHGEAMANNYRVIQKYGTFMTTLAEVKNRADMIIFVATDTHSSYPRFFERFVWDQPSLAGLGKNQRDIVFLGENLDEKVGKNPNGKPALHIDCKVKQIDEYLTLLRAMLQGNRYDVSHFPENDFSKLKKLVGMIEKASYGVIIWDPAGFTETTGDISIQLLSAIIRDLNKNKRFAGLSLGGNNGANAFAAVCTWQTGFPLRVSYREGKPHHDMFSYSQKKILADDTHDLLLWLSSFDSSTPRPATSRPAIVLSRPSVRAMNSAAVYIPVGTPGIDHPGNLMRTDNVISLRLKQLRDIQLPEAAMIIKEIEDRI